MVAATLENSQFSENSQWEKRLVRDGTGDGSRLLSGQESNMGATRCVCDGESWGLAKQVSSVDS